MRELGTKADPASSEIALDGRPLRICETIYLLALNKPSGVLSTREDDRERSTVMSFVPEELRTLVYPVGRLDYNSTGLLLLTNDGPLAFRLTHPSHHVPKTYQVTAERPVGDAEVALLRSGVQIEDGFTAPAEVKVDPRDDRYLTIVLYEGRKRQIRRMLRAVGNEVISLQRVAIGPMKLGNLAEGELRPLTPDEVAALRKAVELEA